MQRGCIEGVSNDVFIKDPPTWQGTQWTQGFLAQTRATFQGEVIWTFVSTCFGKTTEQKPVPLKLVSRSCSAKTDAKRTLK